LAEKELKPVRKNMEIQAGKCDFSVLHGSNLAFQMTWMEKNAKNP